MALGILAFAFVALLGLIPAGLDTFRKSMDTTVTSYIAHRLVNEAQETDFKTYIDQNKPSNDPLKYRYYDDEGQLLDYANPKDKLRVIYEANVVVNGADPTPQSPTLPGSSAANDNIATVTIQIANNPTGKTLGTPGTLWKPETIRNSNVAVTTYSTAISGNSKNK